MEKRKIEDLSNLVFGLALTLGAINLVAPSQGGLVPLVEVLISFGLGFAIIMWIWLVYSGLVTEQDMSKPGRLSLNVVLLFLVVVEPFLLSVTMGEGEPASAGRTAYAIDLGLALLILGLFNHLAMTERRLVPDEKARRNVQEGRNLSFLASAIFFLSLVPPLVLEDLGARVQEVMWFAVLALLAIRWLRRQRIKQEG